METLVEKKLGRERNIKSRRPTEQKLKSERRNEMDQAGLGDRPGKGAGIHIDGVL